MIDMICSLQTCLFDYLTYRRLNLKDMIGMI